MRAPDPFPAPAQAGEASELAPRPKPTSTIRSRPAQEKVPANQALEKAPAPQPNVDNDGDQVMTQAPQGSQSKPAAFEDTLVEQMERTPARNSMEGQAPQATPKSTPIRSPCLKKLRENVPTPKKSLFNQDWRHVMIKKAFTNTSNNVMECLHRMLREGPELVMAKWATLDFMGADILLLLGPMWLASGFAEVINTFPLP